MRIPVTVNAVASAVIVVVCAASAGGVSWMAHDYVMEFAYFVEQGSYTEEKWRAVPEVRHEELLMAVSDAASERYSEVLESYNSLSAKWDADNADPLLRQITQRKIEEVRLWLGDEGAEYLSAKRDAVMALVAKLRSGAAFDQADTAAADAYLTREFAAQVKSAATHKFNQASSTPKQTADFRAGENARTAANGGTASLNTFYDGGGGRGLLSGEGAVAPSISNTPAALTASPRGPASNTLKTTYVPAMGHDSSRVSDSTPADYSSMSPEARRIYEVHAAVVDTYKGRSMGAGTLRGTMGNMSGFDRQECSGDSDTSLWCRYARVYSNAASWYAGALDLDDGKGMDNTPADVSREGVRVSSVRLQKGEYMRCYNWASAIDQTAAASGVSSVFERKEVVLGGPMGLGEHHYMVYIGEGQIYISDPWKNGGVLMVVPDTPANRKKWANE